MQVHRYEATPQFREIGAQLYVASVPQPFYAPNNIYLILSDQPTLIDSGYIQSLGMLQRALRGLGLGFRDLAHIFYTHEHIDHISGALTLRHYTRAKFYGMKGMAAWVGDYSLHIQLHQRAMERLIYKAHPERSLRLEMLEKTRAAWVRFLSSTSGQGRYDDRLRMDVELVEGDVIDIGGRELGFLHTPGHNRHHLTPYLLGEGLYFTGDLVLENISSIYAELDGNLQHYHRSLSRLLKLPIKRLLPGHGAEPASPQKAIKLISKTLSLLERGVVRRLRDAEYDLAELTRAALGEKAQMSSHYITALATVHAILLELIARGQVGIREADPPYERYFWQSDLHDRSAGADLQ
ncbi:MAG: MBL fold metallo-hydrolase [Leptospirales bacterium]|nr:MBL fold metallo-hydrolase [Leptospirales bacterium]